VRAPELGAGSMGKLRGLALELVDGGTSDRAWWGIGAGVGARGRQRGTAARRARKARERWSGTVEMKNQGPP